MDATASRTGSSTSWEANGDASPRLSQKAAIAELGERALRGSDVDGLMQLAVDLLCDVLEVDYAKVLHQPAAGEALILVAGSGWQDHILRGETTVPDNLESQAGFTLASTEPVFVEDLGNETRFKGPQLLLDHSVVSGVSVVIQGRERPYGILGVHSTRSLRFTEGDGDFLRSVANLLGSAIENRRAVDEAEQSARYKTALAECARALLASSGEGRVQEALESLFVATEATFVYVERNVVHPELGFCTTVVAEAVDDQGEGLEYESDLEYWDIVPWDRMPTTRASLETGRPIVIIPAELEGPEYEVYAADPYPVKSEVEVPIFVSGEWAGLIGFSDQVTVRQWTDSDVSLLTTAGRLIGAFWERESDRERLEELNRAKDAFLASVAHELRTPLTAVVGFGQVLQEGADSMSSEERTELLDVMVEQGSDLTNIISDLLVAARADIGALEVESVPVNLHPQVLQVLDSIEQVTKTSVTGEQVRALGDADRIRQVLRNLVSNAVRYGGDHVRVEVLADGTEACVLVCDSGAPIPEEDRERIFEPYRRAHNAPGLVDSLGLGLAISRQLARLMGGDLTYRYENGESVFELTLPIST
ncbi:MAG: ATP-binding protein [Acidimicrobiia bacterium]